MEHSSFKAITLLIKKASYCISICLYMLNPKLIAFPSKERSDPDWGLPSQSLRAVHCEAGQTHPPTDTHRYQRQPQPTHNHDRQLKHTYILIEIRANWPNSQNFCWGPSLCPIEFITLNFQHHEFLLILILFLLYEKIIVNCRENSFKCYNTALEQSQGSQFGTLDRCFDPSTELGSGVRVQWKRSKL